MTDRETRDPRAGDSSGRRWLGSWPWWVLPIGLVAGIWLSHSMAERLEREAWESWRELASDEASEYTLVSQFRVTQGFAALRGMRGWLSRSTEPDQATFEAARAEVETWRLEVEVESLALLQRVARNDREALEAELGVRFTRVDDPAEVSPLVYESFVVRALEEEDGLVARYADLVTVPVFRDALRTAYRQPRAVTLSQSFDGPDDRRYVMLALRSEHFEGEGLVVGFVDLTQFVLDLEGDHLPIGMSLRIAERSSQAQENLTLVPAVGGLDPAPGTLHSIIMRIGFGLSAWQLFWDYQPDFAGGPRLAPARFVRYGGSALALLIFASLALLLADNARVRRIVQTRTAELDRANAELTTTLENTAEGVFMIDEHLRIVSFNQRSADLLGLAESFLKQRPSLAELYEYQLQQGEFGDGEAENVSAALDRLESTADPFRYERTRPNGTVLEVHHSPLPEGGWVRTFIDITERKQLQLATERAREEAESASQMKSALLANVSHEVRTPLSAVIGLSRLAEEGSAEAPTREFLAKINRAARALLSIVDDLLDSAKIEAGKLTLEKRPFSIEELFGNVDDVITVHAAQKQLRFKTSLAPGVPAQLLGDELRVRQVLINLLANAIRFTRQGEVRLAVRPAPEVARDCIAFAVADTGVGMDEAQLARLFEPFVQADKTVPRLYGGTGLGLALCKQLVEAMGGTITASSEPGVGTLLTVVLPLPRAAAQAVSEPERLAAPSRDLTLQGRVMVVEDDPLIREVDVLVLERMGLTVVAVSSGEEALEQLQDGSDPTDMPDSTGTGERGERTERADWLAVLMDVHLPGLDGFETTRRMRELREGRAVPIIGLTAYGSQETDERCEAAGMNTYLVKPLDPDALTRVLRAVSAEDETVPGSAASEQTGPHKAVRRDTSTATAELLAINQETALERLGGDHGLFLELLGEFEARWGDGVERIADALYDDNVKAAADLAHGLAGASGTLGADQLCAAARLLEARLRKGGNQTISLDSLRSAQARTLASLRELRMSH